MVSPYVAETVAVGLMARALRKQPSLSEPGVVRHCLALAGFPKADIARFSEKAIAYERARRLAFLKG